MSKNFIFIKSNKEHTVLLNNLLLLYEHEVNSNLNYICPLTSDGRYYGYADASWFIEKCDTYIICAEGFDYEREIAGFIDFSINSDNNIVYLSDLYILPKYRGFLFRKLIEFIKSIVSGFDMEFVLWAHNYKAEKTYLKIFKRYNYACDINDIDMNGIKSKKYHVHLRT